MAKVSDLVDDLKRAIHVRNGIGTRINTYENRCALREQGRIVNELKRDIIGQIKNEELD